MDLVFQREAGVIVSETNTMLGFFEGEPGSVDFPTEFIKELHRTRPGYIHRLTHMHPDGMFELSNTDKGMMRAWAWTFHPFPFRLGVVSREKGMGFREVVYTAILEPREIWLSKGKGIREITIYPEEENYFYQSDDIFGWSQLLIEKTHIIK